MLTMTQAHNNPVADGTLVTLTCETDEGNPTPVIQWYKEGTQQITPNPGDVVNTQGSYSAMKTRSVIRVTVKSTDNNAVYSCSVNNTLKQAYTFNVTCKIYFYIYKNEFMVFCFF
jgi:hypothetical protein